MKKIILHLTAYIVALAIISINKDCYSQDVIVNGNIDKDSILVGEPFNYNLDVKAPNNYIIDWGNIEDTLSGSIEFVGKSEIKEQIIDNSNDILFSQTLTLTSFDTGYIKIPSICIRYSESTNDTLTHVSFSDYSEIYVSSVSIDTTSAYRPIKMPIKQNITFEETIPYLLVIIAVLGVVFLTIILIRRFRKNSVIVTESSKPQIPAIITAREKMAVLKDSNLWQSGKYKEYYTDLTGIAREYLEGQFDIDAIEMTSEEILEEVKNIQLEAHVFNKLKDTLFTADLVKFAKAVPSSSENENAFNDINSFIEESYVFHQEQARKKAEEEKNKKYDFEEDSKNQDKEETK